ncbi:MAG: hypothetical protein RLZZ385_2749 [Pseudomonadota bacterium]
MNNRERRRFPRVTLNLGAYLSIVDATFEVKSLDVAPSGIQVECGQTVIDHLQDAKAETGRYPKLEVLFSLPDDSTPVSVDCTVNYQRRQDQNVYLLGLLFHDLSPIDSARLSRYFAARDSDS